MAEITGLRNNALPFPVYAAPWYALVEIRDNDGDLVTSAAGLDAELSLNGDTFADAAGTEVEIGRGVYGIPLSAAEMTADVVRLYMGTSTTDAKAATDEFHPVKLTVLDSGTAAANEAGATTITLASSAVAIDDYYNGCLVVATIDSVVEARIISDYAGSTKVATVSPAFVQANVDNNDTYVVYQPWGRQFTDSNLQGWKSTAAATVHTAGHPVVTIKDGTGTGEIDTTSGGVLVAAFAANSITAGAIANGAIDAATFAAGAIDAAAISADAGAEIADAILNRDMATGTDSGSTTVRTVRQALRFLRNKWSTAAIDATTATLTVTKEDDSTASWTSVVTTDSNAHPVISNDPAGP
jgi:hypothetical protein